jgi:hypothetical protein
VSTTKREGFSWLLTTAMLVVVGVGGYHAYMNSIHEPIGAAQAVATEAKANTLQVVLRLESDNQNLKMMYDERLEDCAVAKEDPEERNCTKAKVQDAKDQLSRLKYNRNATVELKQSVVGIPE